MRLSKELYSKDAIDTAIKAYCDYARITIDEDQNSWILNFLNCKYAEVLTECEFENYLIGLEN